jgi:hypothetical protein
MKPEGAHRSKQKGRHMPVKNFKLFIKSYMYFLAIAEHA